MKVALIYNAVLPAPDYGGTQRVVWGLAKGLSEQGHRVSLVCDPKSHCPFADIIPFNSFRPKEHDLYHYFDPLPNAPNYPHLVTIGGNARPDEVFIPNTVFVSQNHAQRHQATAFVHNGIDPDDYLFESDKEDYLAFLAKASWKVKNLKGAIKIASDAKTPIHVMGGQRWGWPRKFVNRIGMVGGKEKSLQLASAKALLFPVLWDEPFGLAVIEALVSGTPVLATPFGSLSELVDSTVGRLCHSYADFQKALQILPSFNPQTCRDWALSKFHYRNMTQKYLDYYSQVLDGKNVNPTAPRGTKLSRKRYQIS